MLPIFAHSGEIDAPQLTNANGSKDGLLHAMLVTGWKLQTAASCSVTAGVATVTLPSHGYSDMRVLELAGAAVPAINGLKFCRTPTGNTITFPAPGVPDGAVGGTITLKRASCGWSRPYSSGGVSIYTRTDVTASDMALWINDSGSAGADPTYARARAVWDVSGLSSWLDQAPQEGQLAGGVYWPKGQNTATPKRWVFFGDGKRFYLFTSGVFFTPESYQGALNGPMFFGDPISYHPGDAFPPLIVGATSTSTSLDQAGLAIVRGAGLGSQPASGGWLARAASQIGRPVAAGVLGFGSSPNLGGQGPIFPSPVGNGLVLSKPVYLVEATSAAGYPVRGEMPGMAAPLANIGGGELHLQMLDSVMGSTAIWVLVACQITGSYGHLAFNISEPWD